MVEIKVCGVTSPKDAKMAVDFGADLIGVIVDVEIETPREVEVSQAEKIIDSTPEGIETVTVTMPEDAKDALKIARRLSTDYIQIHSEMDPSGISKIRKGGDHKVIGVYSISAGTDYSEDILEEAESIAEVTDYLLLDTVKSDGNGRKVHDWGISSEINENLNTPVILAGGLNPSNVDRAIERVNPFAVDVASGVESGPGKKDPDLVREFIQNVGEKL